MARAAWAAILEESRPVAHLDQAGELVAFDVADKGPLPPRPWLDLWHLPFRGDYIGGKATMLLVAAEEWARYPG